MKFKSFYKHTSSKHLLMITFVFAQNWTNICFSVSIELMMSYILDVGTWGLTSGETPQRWWPRRWWWSQRWWVCTSPVQPGSPSTADNSQDMDTHTQTRDTGFHLPVQKQFNKGFYTIRRCVENRNQWQMTELIQAHYHWKAFISR